MLELGTLILNRLIREGLAEKIAFAQRPDVGKGARTYGKQTFQAEQQAAARTLSTNALG